MKFPNYKHQEIESEILLYWKRHEIVETLREKNKLGKPYYFLQGPPYTSGRVHIGTAWQTSMKDIILRYKRMLGMDVWDRMGYDMHGLPTEQKVMAKLKLRNKEDIEKFGLDKFTQECYTWCKTMMQQMNQDFLRLGITLDYTNPYQPITDTYMESEWWLIKQAEKKKRLYQGLRTMHWDAATQSAVAKHELEYKELTDTSIYVKFPHQDDPKKYFIVWTTTPWTIPLNLAIMVNPEMNYVEINVNHETWILAEELMESVINKTQIGGFSVKNKFKGKKLEGQFYNHPLNVKEYLPEELQHNPKLFSILLSKEYVDASAGTGLVHCAPGCGPEDYEVGHLNKIPPFNCVNEEGLFKNFGKFTDWRAKLDDNKFIESIEDSGALLAKEPYVHDYPHGERSHQPVIFRTTKQWFFKVEDLKNKMLAANKKISWNPSSAKNAFNSWLENLRDNSITKQRYWGTPVPIWQADEGDYIVVENIKELEKLSGQKVTGMHIPDIDNIVIKKNGKTYTRIPDVLDVWIDAGTASWNGLDYPQKEEFFKKYFPADFILEGKDQIRGWFNLLMVSSFLAFDKPSFKNVYMNGFVTDIEGTKMSKSLGNIITPDELIDRHGADVLRFYMFRNNAGEDINFSWDECKVKQRQLHILWNTHKLLINLSKENKLNPSTIKNMSLGIEEKYILSKLNSTIKKVTELLESYRLDEIVLPLEDLFLELSRTYIQMIRDKSSLGNKDEKSTCIYTIYTCLLGLIKMFQLISPFISEAIYLNLKEEFQLKEASISHYSWPKIDEKMIDSSLENSMGIVQDIITSSLNAREKTKRGLRWPVKEFIVISHDKEIKKAVKDLNQILKSQTNSKSFIYQEEMKNVKLSISANPSKIGPSFGKLSPEIIQSINGENPDKIIESLDKKNFFELQLKKQKLSITREMLNITRTVPENYIGAESSNFMVYLNITTTEELEDEGYARELMRNIQDARKKAGLEKSDSIKLYLKSSRNIIEFEGDIKDKVGASELTFAKIDCDEKHQNCQEFKIKNEEFKIWFSKDV